MSALKSEIISEFLTERTYLRQEVDEIFKFYQKNELSRIDRQRGKTKKQNIDLYKNLSKTLTVYTI